MDGNQTAVLVSLSPDRKNVVLALPEGGVQLTIEAARELALQLVRWSTIAEAYARSPREAPELVPVMAVVQ